MWNGFRLFFMAALGVAVCSLAARGADDPKNDDKTPSRSNSRQPTASRLRGASIPPHPRARPKPRKRPYCFYTTSMPKRGGSSNQPGWDELAKTITERRLLRPQIRLPRLRQQHERQLLVLEGNVTTANMSAAAHKAKPPSTISHKDFDANRRRILSLSGQRHRRRQGIPGPTQRRGQANTSSLIVIGAGEGATLGAMWMASEWHRQKSERHRR